MTAWLVLLVPGLLWVSSVLSQQNGGKNFVFPGQDSQDSQDSDSDNHTSFRLSEPVRKGFDSENVTEQEINNVFITIKLQNQKQNKFYTRNQYFCQDESHHGKLGQQ